MGDAKGRLLGSGVSRRAESRHVVKTAQTLALRARIVLICAEGGHNKEVAAKLYVDEGTVGNGGGALSSAGWMAYGMSRVPERQKIRTVSVHTPVVIACMVGSSESWETLTAPLPWRSRAGGGAVHSINSGLTHRGKYVSIRSPRWRGRSAWAASRGRAPLRS